MKTSRSTSFKEITQVIFSLLGIIPYLLAIYIMIHIKADLTETILLIAAAALVSHLTGFSLMRRIGSQMQELSDKACAAANAPSKQPIQIDAQAPQELSEMAHHFNTMLAEVDKSNRNYREVTTKLMLYAKDIEDYQKKLGEEIIIRHRLSRYIGQNVVDQLLQAEGDMPLQNRKCMATVLFADIRSFTTISENMEPEEIISMLNEYFDCMVKIIFEHRGVLDKFVGDELMAVFGLVGTPDKAPMDAIHAAREMQNEVQALILERQQQGMPVFEIGIGINTGEVVVGNVGSQNRMDYTVIGDTVNVGARLEQIAKGNQILVGEKTHEQCAQYFHMIEQGGIKVRNRAEPVKCYVVTG
ncbi:MAG: adenylate/guanylate cyclase domain-containing protein [Mariprofundaceae bacterium]